jgi:hypothetical protein
MIRRWPCTLTWEITQKRQWQWGEQKKTMRTINFMMLQVFHIPCNSILTHQSPWKGGKTTTHNTASKWLRDDHTQQCKKWLKEDDNNDMNLFTWQKDHENDQPNDIVKALHSLWLHPCTPKPHESGVGGIKAQCTTMQVND